MKMKLIALCIICMECCAQPANDVITFFIRPLPLSSHSAQDSQKFAQKLQTPGKLLKSMVKKSLTPYLFYSGIYAAYAGTATHSNPDGQIFFDRATPEAKLHVLVTEDMKAVPINPVKDKTLYGFTIDPKAESAQYLFERVQNPETGLYYWHVTPEPINKKKILDPDTLIIFAHPKYLIAPLGSSTTQLTENLVLPDFYATEKNKSAANAFRFFKLRHYFAPVKSEYSFKPDEYQKKITNT